VVVLLAYGQPATLAAGVLLLLLALGGWLFYERRQRRRGDTLEGRALSALRSVAGAAFTAEADVAPARRRVAVLARAAGRRGDAAAPSGGDVRGGGQPPASSEAAADPASATSDAPVASGAIAPEMRAPASEVGRPDPSWVNVPDLRTDEKQAGDSASLVAKAAAAAAKGAAAA
ncbi:MAG: hypothetical protein VXW43_19910, partial [Pseudomonadota bacterium]|nr:hypothetical protein [Pseudomonadota bacterium]